MLIIGHHDRKGRLLRG